MPRIIARGIQGFSIVEAGIAMGIASVVAAGVAASLNHVQKGARALSLSTQVISSQSQLHLALGSESACTEILRNLPYPSGQVMKFAVAFPVARRTLRASNRSEHGQGLKLSPEIALLTVGPQASGVLVDEIEFARIQPLSQRGDRAEHLVSVRVTGRKSEQVISGSNAFRSEFWLKITTTGNAGNAFSDLMLGCKSASSPDTNPVTCADLGGVDNPIYTEGGNQPRCHTRQLLVGTTELRGMQEWLDALSIADRPETAAFRNGIFSEGLLASLSGVRAYKRWSPWSPEFMAHTVSEDDSGGFAVARQGPQFQFFRGRKEVSGQMTPVEAGDLVGRVTASGQVRIPGGGTIHGGYAAGIEFVAEGAWTTSGAPSGIRFHVAGATEQNYNVARPALEIHSNRDAELHGNLTVNTLQVEGPSAAPGALLTATSDAGETRWKQLRTYESPVLFHTTTTTCVRSTVGEIWVGNGHIVTVGTNTYEIGGDPVQLNLDTASGKTLLYCSLSRYRSDQGNRGTAEGGERCKVSRVGGRWILHAHSWNGDTARPHPYIAGAPEGSCVECSATCIYLE